MDTAAGVHHVFRPALPSLLNGYASIEKALGVKMDTLMEDAILI